MSDHFSSTPAAIDMDDDTLARECAEIIVANHLTLTQLAALRANHARRNTNHDPLPVVHLSFEPLGHHWLLTELDEDCIAFGLCDLGMGFPELGYVSLGEIFSSKIGFAIVNDQNFRAIAPLSEYAAHARAAEQVVLTWEGAPHGAIPPASEATAADNREQLLDDAVSAPDNTGAEDCIPLASFLADFREPLLAQINQQTPVVYDGQHEAWQDTLLQNLKRQPFAAQKERILACYAGLVNHGLPAVFLNGEMGTGKTLMGICVSALFPQGYSAKPVLVICPPHLVYKWRREILDTVPDAVVHTINGSHAIHDLIRFRRDLQTGRYNDGKLHYLIFGRVRMRMGFYWKPAYWQRNYHYIEHDEDGKNVVVGYPAIACPNCGQFQLNRNGTPLSAYDGWGSERRERCRHCQQPLWTMRHKEAGDESAERKLRKFLNLLPGIGKVTADKLIAMFGVEMLTRIVDDNIYDFVNLCDSQGEFVFKDKHATALEKALGRLEFALRMISYQPSEYVKRYFPRKSFSLAIIDEAHEYKNAGSAQGQAMAVLCNEAEKVLCLTGTLMGGYASDLFYLLYRAMPGIMTRLGFGAKGNNSFAAAETRFMRQYGCLIDVYSYRHDEGSYQTSRARKTSLHVKKAPGFSPLGIARFILPYTVFMRLESLGKGILPSYSEETRNIEMTSTMTDCYAVFREKLVSALKTALANRDNRLTGAVISALLRWPDTCFREEAVSDPRNRKEVLAKVASLFAPDEPTPKEQDILDVCLAEKALGRRCIVYTTYTGHHDTGSRLCHLLETAGLKVAVLRATVSSDVREDWIADRVERGIDVLITNPELVKTGLDLLAFPTIYFAQTGYNVYTVAQAARRSWRIGQKEAVKVYFACYNGSAQTECLELMAKKIKAAQSTQGVMPETGLDSFLDDEENSENSLAESLAKQLLGAR